MRVIAEGKLYDTETAREIARAQYYMPGSPKRYDETLYRTAKGNWFLSTVKTDLNPCRAWDSESDPVITPLEQDAALRWCERNFIATAIVCQHFDVEEA